MRGRMIELHANHTVAGNPDRFRAGVTVIKDGDASWRDGLSVPAKLSAAALSWPLFGRYGYRYDGRAGPRSRPARAAPLPSGEQRAETSGPRR